MAKITATERERYVLFQLINPMGHPNRAERRRVDRIFDAMALAEIDDKTRVYAPGTQVSPQIFDDVEAKTFELTSDQRDYVIELLDKPGLTTAGGRMLARFEREIIAGRDGDAASRS